jgi:biopolymer transport protein ExbD
MKLRKKKNRDMAIPTDSFSDIAFLLIIYFLVATSLVKVKSITADLPAGEKSNSVQSDKTPTINLRGNEIFFNDKPLTIEALNQRLAELELGKLDPEKRVVLLESTSGTVYQNYFQALAAISANGGVVALVEDSKSK